jgi:hypothetical protein
VRYFRDILGALGKDVRLLQGGSPEEVKKASGENRLGIHIPITANDEAEAKAKAIRENPDFIVHGIRKA